MWIRSTVLCRFITALMLVVAILPHHECVLCASIEIAPRHTGGESCCCGREATESEHSASERAPCKSPDNPSNCPHCFNKSVGAILSPVVELQQLDWIAFVVSELELSSAMSVRCIDEVALRPPAMGTLHIHLRI